MDKITFNLNQIKSKFNVIDDNVKKFANNSFYKAMQQYVPAYTTTLYTNVTIDENGIRFKSPYARYLYYGKLMVSPTTGSSWASYGEKKVLTDINLKYSKEVHGLATSHWGEEAWIAKKDIIAKEVKSYIERKELIE